MTDVTQAVDNGVNVEALLGARAALTEAPEAARFVWRTTSEWKNGTHTQSSVEKFFGLGEEQRHLFVPVMTSHFWQRNQRDPSVRMGLEVALRSDFANSLVCQQVAGR